MQNYFIMDFKAVHFADKKFRNIIIKPTQQLAAKNYKTAVMDFKVMSPAVKLANIFVKFKKERWRKDYAIKFRVCRLRRLEIQD